MPTVREIEMLIAARRFDEATAAWRACFAEGAADAAGWLALGRIGVRLRRPEASACLERAAEGNADPAPLVLLAQNRLMLGDTLGALHAARAAKLRSPGEVRDLLQLGTVFAHCDAGEEALPLFEEARGLAPEDPAILYNLATAQRTNGLIDVAEQTIGTVIRLRPDDGEAHYLRAGLRRQTAAHNHVAVLQAALARRAARATPADVPLHFALGKELEDLGRHSEAFHHFDTGSRLRRSTFRYDVSGDISTMQALAEHHDGEALGRAAQSRPAAGPIFIVGLPRSGTTLVERILAAHPDVTAGGELEAFPQVTVGAVGAVPNKEAFAARSIQVAGEALGRAYIDQVGSRAGNTPRFTDKLPINALYLGLIVRALPAARIVLVTRNAMANGFAMFSTLFADAYPFSYDLHELGAYMAAWHRLMAHWRSIVGDRLLTLHYEDLVTDPETKTRALLRFSELDWSPRCLAFHDQIGSVASASAVQVRQRIHTESVARWRAYQPLLDPLAMALGEFGR